MSTSAMNKPRTGAAGGASQQRGLLIIGAIVVVAVVAVIVIIALGSANTGNLDLSSIPTSRQTDGAFVLGNPEAPITIVEFADFGCPHCQQYQPEISRFLENYVATGQSKFEYRIFPTAGGDTSVYTGKLLECADEQRVGAFWEGYKLMFQYATSGRYNTDVGRLFATDANLNYSQLLDCSGSATQVNTDIAFGQNNGVTGTPAVMVRYGDGAAQFISFGGVTYDRGNVPYNVLASVVEAANQG